MKLGVGDAVMDVGDWLRSLGLAQYEAVFRQIDIDAGVLGELVDDGRKLYGSPAIVTLLGAGRVPQPVERWRAQS